MKVEHNYIYVRLLEGVLVYVPIIAKKIDEQTYEIQENKYLDLKNDITSIWEFFPGDIVKVEYKENMLIAKELVSSTVKDSKLYKLIFQIVLNANDLSESKFVEYSFELKELLNREDIPQKNHPIVKLFLKNHFGEEK